MEVSRQKPPATVHHDRRGSCRRSRSNKPNQIFNLQDCSPESRSLPQVSQLLQSDRAILRTQDRRKRRHHDSTHPESLAVSAIERAQLRHQLRLQRSVGIKPDQCVDNQPPADSFGFSSAMAMLKNQCKNQPLLNREEEHKLAQTMAHGRECVLMLDQLHEQQSRHNKQYCGLVPSLLQQLHAAQVAKRRLIQANLRLVLKAVSSYSHQKQVDIEDLVQAGLYGLSRGIDKYDPDRGNRVSTVAYMWTREAVGRAYNESARTIKISERALTSTRKITAAQEQYHAAQHVATSSDCIRVLTGLSKQTFANAMKACNLRELSLEAAVESTASSGKLQASTSLAERISSLNDESNSMADSKASAAEALMEGALQQLPADEATVLDHVYGLQDGQPKTRPQVARLMGMGLHHIRKLEQRAMSILRALRITDAATPIHL